MKKRILCIDDDSSMRTLLTTMVSSWGYDITCAPNVREAIEMFEAFNPFLVITDLQIANHIDGATLADRLHRKDPMCIFVAISGYLAAFDLGFLLGAVFTDVLQKPFNNEDLKKIIDYAWDKRCRWSKYL